MAYVVQNFHWFALLLGALVFFHELGHFLIAKMFGVKVLRFSLGFGPRIFGFRKGETEYQLSLLPLGGYVKMLGELPGDVDPEDRGRALSDKPIWQRSAILFAGPAFNFILAFFVYLVMFVGPHTFGATRLGIVSPEGPAWLAGIRPGDRIVSINGEVLQRWEDLRKAVGDRPGETLSVTFERDGVLHTGELAPTPREESDVFDETQTRGRIGVSLQYIEPIVQVVDPESPAALAGVKNGDRVIQAAGVAVSAWHELRHTLASLAQPFPLVVKRGDVEHRFTIAPGAFPEGLSSDIFSAANTAGGYTGLVNRDTVVEKIEPATPAEKAGILPGDRLLTVAVKRPDGKVTERPIGVWGIDLASFSGEDARSEFTLRVQRGRNVITNTFVLEVREELDELKNQHTRYVFGAEPYNVASTYTIDRVVGIGEATKEAVLQVGADATLIARGIAKIFQGDLPLDSMGGPIMLFVIAEKSAKRGLDHFFRMMAIISVNLGLLNLLPMPALDGGHLLFFGIEAIRRRPPSIRTRELAHLVGLVLLITLMVLVFRNDILRYVLG